MVMKTILIMKRTIMMMKRRRRRKKKNKKKVQMTIFREVKGQLGLLIFVLVWLCNIIIKIVKMF
jgi:hypothetical protein